MYPIAAGSETIAKLTKGCGQGAASPASGAALFAPAALAQTMGRLPASEVEAFRKDDPSFDVRQFGIVAGQLMGLLAGLVAVPLGLYVGHTGRGRAVAVNLSRLASMEPSSGVSTR